MYTIACRGVDSAPKVNAAQRRGMTMSVDFMGGGLGGALTNTSGFPRVGFHGSGLCRCRLRERRMTKSQYVHGLIKAFLNTYVICRCASLSISQRNRLNSEIIFGFIPLPSRKHHAAKRCEFFGCRLLSRV